MNQWTAETKAIIDAKTCKTKVGDDFGAYVKGLGMDKITTVEQLRDRIEYVSRLMAIWRTDRRHYYCNWCIPWSSSWYKHKEIFGE